MKSKPIKSDTIAVPVSIKYEATKWRELYVQLCEGDLDAGGNNEFVYSNLAQTAIDLHKKQNQKKLSAQEQELKRSLDTIMPLLFYLNEKALDWSAEEQYFTHARKSIAQLQKKALKGESDSIQKYNEMVREWGNIEPGKFKLIKKNRK